MKTQILKLSYADDPSTFEYCLKQNDDILFFEYDGELFFDRVISITQNSKELIYYNFDGRELKITHEHIDCDDCHFSFHKVILDIEVEQELKRFNKNDILGIIKQHLPEILV